MMHTIGTHSGALAKALTVNSVANGFSTQQCLRGTPAADGLQRGAGTAAECPRSLFMMPYAEGAAGSQFSFRVYGLAQMRAPNLGDPSAAVWIPFLLAEYACTVCNIGGVKQGSGMVTGDDLIESERLCDTIQFVQGDMGVVGKINSTGPGTDLVAYATVDLQGCRYFLFDFKQTDNVGMNCLFFVL